MIFPNVKVQPHWLKTLAIGGPSIYLYADYDDGQVSNCRLVCIWWGDRAEITHDQDVMVRFIEYVNA